MSCAWLISRLRFCFCIDFLLVQERGQTPAINFELFDLWEIMCGHETFFRCKPQHRSDVLEVLVPASFYFIFVPRPAARLIELLHCCEAGIAKLLEVRGLDLSNQRVFANRGNEELHGMTITRDGFLGHFMLAGVEH